MKISRLTVTLLILSLAAISLIGCRAKQTASGTTEYQVMSVTAGNISVEVTSTGNLVYAEREPLSFKANGTVGEILVEVGDEVKTGEVLASLDGEEWQTYLEGLEKTLSTAQRQPSSKELDLLQAQINLQSAEDSLASIQDVKKAQDELEAAQDQLKLHEAMLQEAIVSAPVGTTTTAVIDFWKNQVTTDKAKVTQKQKDLADILAGTSSSLSTSVISQIASRKIQLEISRKRLESAQLALDDALKAVIDAQKALDEAKATSTEILAPFDGVVTVVQVQERATVKKGATVLIVANSSKFEAEMLVNEVDILKINISTPATIELSALPGVSFPAKVTTVAPVATIQQSVVNYRVKAELTATAAVPAAVPSTQAGTEKTTEALKLLENALAKAVQDGRITRAQSDLLKQRLSPIIEVMTPEQIEQMIARGGQGTIGALPGGQGTLRERLGQAGNLSQEQLDQLRQRFQQGGLTGQRYSGIVPETVQLREGLSVTVKLVIQQKANVLLVPNQAITVKGGKSYVTVQKNDGTKEERVITTGLSDWQNTEVVSGLANGEKVVITKTNTSTTTKTTQSQTQFRLPTGGGSGIRLP